MRTSHAFTTLLLVLSLFAPAIAEFSPVEYFDFTGWDQDLISSPDGQTFTDIFGDLDVTVEGIGIFEEPTTASGTLISMSHPNPTENALRFYFSRPLRLVIESLTVDSNETHSIFTASTEEYLNNFGAEPTVTSVGTGISIQGDGFTIYPDGAAFGQTLTGAVDVVMLSYDSTGLDKFGFWRVGTLVPEPNSIALLGIGGLGLLMQFRSRRESW